MRVRVRPTKINGGAFSLMRRDVKKIGVVVSQLTTFVYVVTYY